MDALWTWYAGIEGSRWMAPALIGLRIVLIVIAAWVLVTVLQRVVRITRMRIQLRLDGLDAQRRAETLGRVLRYLIAVVVGAIALMLVLSEVGISLAPILGAINITFFFA